MIFATILIRFKKDITLNLRYLKKKVTLLIRKGGGIT